MAGLANWDHVDGRSSNTERSFDTLGDDLSGGDAELTIALHPGIGEIKTVMRLTETAER